MKKLVVGLVLIIVVSSFVLYYNYNPNVVGNLFDVLSYISFQSQNLNQYEQKCKSSIENRLNVLSKVIIFNVNYRLVELKSFDSVNKSAEYLKEQWLVDVYTTNIFGEQHFNSISPVAKDLSDLNGQPNIIGIIRISTRNQETGLEVKFHMSVVCDEFGNLGENSIKALSS